VYRQSLHRPKLELPTRKNWQNITERREKNLKIIFERIKCNLLIGLNMQNGKNRLVNYNGQDQFLKEGWI